MKVPGGNKMKRKEKLRKRKTFIKIKNGVVWKMPGEKTEQLKVPGGVGD